MKKYIIQITPESSELVNDTDSKKRILEVYSELEKIAEKDFDSCDELITELKKAKCHIDPARPVTQHSESDEGLPFYFYTPRRFLMGKIRAKGECYLGRMYIQEHM